MSTTMLARLKSWIALVLDSWKKSAIGLLFLPVMLMGAIGAVVFVPLATGFEMGMDFMMWLANTKRERR